MSDQISGNIVRPFQLESSSLRGRIVRMDDVLDGILIGHDYPDVVRKVLAETVTLCALLSSMLKYEGIFTLQTSGDGPISMLVADMTSDGKIRGCAAYNEERVAILTKQLAAFSKNLGEGSDHDLAQLLGKGHIAFTVDQGDDTDRYQGIVELKGQSLVDCVQHYFVQSEQIDTGIILAAGKREGKWRSAGLMLQQMPTEGGDKVLSNFDEDGWRRAMMLMQTCTEDELLAPTLHGHDILLRLFHEEGIRLFDPLPLTHECRCSQEKVNGVVNMLTLQDLKEIREEQDFAMTCEFCSKEYTIDASIIEAQYKALLDNAPDEK